MNGAGAGGEGEGGGGGVMCFLFCVYDMIMMDSGKEGWRGEGEVMIKT